jgi:4-hydroxyphenylacetate 3-monooxygenase
MAIPTEADVTGAAADAVDQYLQSATLPGPERVRLFRLAWDFAVSGFGGRQNLYEYYFFGDPVRMAGAYLKATDREAYKERVKSFLERTA